MFDMKSSEFLTNGGNVDLWHVRYVNRFGRGLPFTQLELAGWTDEMICKRIRYALEKDEPIEIDDADENEYI